MAAEQQARDQQEQGMLNNIGGREEEAPGPEAAAPGIDTPGKSAGIGWMGYVGGLLWVTVLVGTGGVAWLIFISAS